MTEKWRMAFRKGYCPGISDAGLKALWKALAEDDSRLIQGATCSPPPLQCCQDWPCEAACIIGFAGWQGEGLETVAEVEEFFARLSFDADQRLEEPAGCRTFLNWIDDTPRTEMRRDLILEVEEELAQRERAGIRTLFPPVPPDERWET